MPEDLGHDCLSRMSEILDPTPDIAYLQRRIIRLGKKVQRVAARVENANKQRGSGLSS